MKTATQISFTGTQTGGGVGSLIQAWGPWILF